MIEDQKYTLRISEGSGWENSNWLLCLFEAEVPNGSTKQIAKLGPEWKSVVLHAFKELEDAEKCRDEILRSLILQASKMSPSSERR